MGFWEFASHNTMVRSVLNVTAVFFAGKESGTGIFSRKSERSCSTKHLKHWPSPGNAEIRVAAQKMVSFSSIGWVTIEVFKFECQVPVFVKRLAVLTSRAYGIQWHAWEKDYSFRWFCLYGLFDQRSCLLVRLVMVYFCTTVPPYLELIGRSNGATIWGRNNYKLWTGSGTHFLNVQIFCTCVSRGKKELEISISLIWNTLVKLKSESSSPVRLKVLWHFFVQVRLDFLRLQLWVQVCPELVHRHHLCCT